ncbi:hypothetical protein CLOM_g1023 [Closterium sp. NIES-68]|nr:hypothetical protein CLOM_g1023 [Closterium sp. NIES-68]
MLAASPPFVQHVLQDRWQQQQQQQIGSSPQQLFEPHVVAASRAPVVADNKLRELASMASLAHHPSSPPPPPASHAQSPAAFAEPWIAGSDSPCAQSAAQSPPSGPPPRLSAGCGDSLPSPIPTPPCTCYSRLPAGCASDPHAPTVKYIGVRLRGRNRWVAEIKDNNHGVRKWLGTFACPVQAAQAFDAAARAIRGPKTKANFKRGDAAFVEDVPEVLSVLAYCAQGKPPLAAPGSAEGCARRAAGAALLAAVPVCRGESPMQSLPAGPQAGRRPGKPRTSPALGPLPLAIGPPTIAAPSLVGANPPAATPPAVRPPVPSPSSSSLVAASPMLPAASPCCRPPAPGLKPRRQRPSRLRARSRSPSSAKARCRPRCCPWRRSPRHTRPASAL